MGLLKSIAPLALAAALAHPSAHSLLHSRQLWATVDVCDSKKQPNTIGIRGSMPGDRDAKDTMYMRFAVQYLQPATRRWASAGRHAESPMLNVGSAAVARQAGQSFQLAPVKGQAAIALRGAVTFQWRRGARVLASAVRFTEAGHHSLAGAEPPGFSAATCKLP